MSGLKARLEVLGCPYVRDVDDSWIRELLAQPGDARNRMMTWLFVKFDASLKATIDAPGSRLGDNETKRLLSVASQLALCDSSDIDLILGKASASREATFWDDLVDLVTAATIPSQSDQVGVESLQQGRSSLQDQFQKDCHLMSSLCRQGNLQSALSTNMTLFPPDLIRICEQRQATTASVSSSQHQKKVSLPRPNDQELLALRQSLSTQIVQRREDLQRLAESYSAKLFYDDPSSCSHFCRTLQITANTLQQLTESFIASYSEECLPWVQPAEPLLEDLGPVCEAVLVQLKSIACVFSQLQRSQSLYTSLAKQSDSAVLDSMANSADVHDSAVAALQRLSATLQTVLSSGAS